VDHPVYFSSRKLSTAEWNYTTIEREVLKMVYSLQRFCHYLLRGSFKFFTNHYALKYLVKKPILEGRICRWLLLFQEFTFEVIVKMGRLNVGPNHLSRLENGESRGSLDDKIPNADIFRVEAIPNYLNEIATYLTVGKFPEQYTPVQRRHLVDQAAECQLIARHLYKMGLDEVLRRCILDHEREAILWESNNGIVGGHVVEKPIERKVLQAGLWWLTLHVDIKEFVKKCDVCQRMGRPSHRDELPLQPVQVLQPFEKWAVDFIGPITLVARHLKAPYIITTKEYLKRWVEAAAVRNCMVETAARFIFKNIISQFGFPKSLTSDQGTHFINETVKSLLERFMIQHHKRSLYHPQANDTVEVFNKILEKFLTKICNAHRDDWDERILATLWAYKTIVKRMNNQTPF